MSKTKKLLMALMLLIAVLLIPNMVSATVGYTRNFPSNDGTIELNITGLELSDSKQYEFALVSIGGTPDADSWNLITNRTTNTAKLVLSSGTSKIINVLKVADEGQIFIREKDNTEEYIVNRLNVDLTLPYLQSLSYTKNSTEYSLVGLLYGAIGNAYGYTGTSHTYIQWQKVQNTELITKFLEIKNSNGSFTGLENYLPTRPTMDWDSTRYANYTSKNDGLYLLWVKRTGENCKEVYSCIIHDGLPDATTLDQYVGVSSTGPRIQEIRAKGSSFITSAGNSYEYHEKPGNQVTITIKFDQEIVKNTAPTLTIKFGTGNNIELTTCEAGANTLTYTYTVKEGDLGTFQVISFTGGNVTNNEGTAAVLTLPELVGYKVVAVEGDATQEEPEDTKEYISFPYIIYFGTTTIDLKEGAYDGDYTMYYQFVEVTNENQETKYDDTKWIKTEDGKLKEPSLEFTGEKKFDLWIKLVMEDETVYENYRYKFNGTSTPPSNEPTNQEKPSVTDKDTTTADKNLPNTGRVILFWIIGIVAVSGIVARVRYKKLYM